jgi:hypothetical protein
MPEPRSYIVATIEECDYTPVADAAAYLDVSISTVHNLINSRRKRLVARDFGPQLLVEVDSLEAEKARRDAEKSEQVAA